jgi:hypothetical protein
MRHPLEVTRIERHYRLDRLRLSRSPSIHHRGLARISGQRSELCARAAEALDGGVKGKSHAAGAVAGVIRRTICRQTA